MITKGIISFILVFFWSSTTHSGISHNHVSAQIEKQEECLVTDEIDWNTKISFLTQKEAQDIDNELMGTTGGFTLDQLMELAGLSVASAIYDYLGNYNSSSSSSSSSSTNTILILAGPGNNGGDGIVAARHLKHFGYNVDILYPKDKGTFNNLIQQSKNLGIEILDHSSDSFQLEKVITDDGKYIAIVDGLFGFGFQGELRSPFDSYIAQLTSLELTPVISIDIPSGWQIDLTDMEPKINGFMPNVLVSLTAPKICARNFVGIHYLGGRFLTKNLITNYNLTLPEYKSYLQFVKIPGWKNG